MYSHILYVMIMKRSQEGGNKIMIKMICDRCGKEIEGTTYYTIYIRAEDIKPINECMCTASTAIQNVANAFAALNARPHYCKECRDKIEAFIKNA